jgi:hypothetical protein
LAIALWIAVPFAPQAEAAEGGSIVGRVYDPQGATVPRAQVRILRRSDAFRKEATADAEGRFSLSDLDSGDYRITAEAIGFPQVARELSLPANGSLSIDLRFATLSGQNESVTVCPYRKPRTG